MPFRKRAGATLSPEAGGVGPRTGRRARARRSTRLLGQAVVLTCLGGLLSPGVAAADPDAGKEASGHVRDLVGRMTLDEKLTFLHWTTGPEGAPPVKGVGYLPGVPRLGIPPMQASDGPVGIRLNGGRATAMPSPVALAASFDDGLATEYGKVLGREGRAFGQDVVLAPMVNNIRVPYGGRNFETFSEDPLVSARMAAAQVRGIQGQGLMATVKHYAANNQEDNRDGVNVTVDEQTLNELELPGFRGAVEAGAASVMCAYNGVNGSPSCSNAELLQNVLREQWRFTGWVMSDWLAARDTSDITKGLDQELGLDLDHEPAPGEEIPDARYFGARLKAAIQSGTVPEALLDRSVIRIVGQMERFGLLAKKPPARPDRDPQAGRDAARTIAENGAVLLRNEHRTLPLAGGPGADIAVIGDGAKRPKVSGLGSAYVVPDRATAPLDALRDRAGDSATVTYEAGEDLVGVPLPDHALTPAFHNGRQLEQGGRATFYRGALTVPADGDYRIALGALGGMVTLQIAGQDPIVAAAVYGDRTSVVLPLTRGTHQVEMSGWAWQDSPLSVDLSWVTPEAAAADFDRAVAAAAGARTAVVFVQDEGSEGVDRTSLSLPGRQDQLIAAVAKANPRTVVVLNTGSSVLMPWLRDTAAVLNMWYPGQEGAEATAALLFGDANPSGRLTQTFPASEDQHPVAGDPQRYPGTGGEVAYSEGILTGYRWYDRNGIRPLFPFGHGLSYTSFAYDDLEAVPVADGLRVRLTVRNTGTRDGQEVVQVYLGPSPDVTAPQADRKLVGYTKVALRAGQEKRVTLAVDRQQLMYWNSESHGWRPGTGERALQVGATPAGPHLRTTVTVPRR
ncbi:glycoside hydrolase family 3 C-terminal domain-containing protein [Streptomyces sp. ACA25]|uniref:beta-glucosidase family protein n=1 Tax=Streptomyces sp. ACA25 TaxID=3022596 RepID=UPI002307F9F5|nr:glycoside hydrolase family 3 C-terminal domain-containing protein [Streptomyces sp. ACA25]MDB1090303.1 glycoside hydrolase family 3 C-terminal domain-containing protein [Streptomyces sp. ACA25]